MERQQRSYDPTTAMVQERYFVIGYCKDADFGGSCLQCGEQYRGDSEPNIPITLVECNRVLCFRCVEAVHLWQLKETPDRYYCDHCNGTHHTGIYDTKKLISVDTEYEWENKLMLVHFVFGDEPKPRSSESSTSDSSLARQLHGLSMAHSTSSK